MEENTETQSQEMQEPRQEQKETSFNQTPSNVAFPTVGSPQKSGGPKTILIIGILILVAILGFVVYKSATKSSNAPTETTNFDNLTTPSSESTLPEAPVATSTPKAVDRSSVSVVIQNGTGITGEAAYLQTQIKNMGYSDIKVSNASSQDASTTTVTFSSSLGSDIVSEITQKLNGIYQKVTTSTSGSGTSDVLIVTGLRKGATAKPSATPAATSSPTASPTPTATP